MRSPDNNGSLSPARDDLTPFSGYAPILTPDEAARMLRISKSTLYQHISAGRYRSAVKRGKPLRFLRDQLVREFFKR